MELTSKQIEIFNKIFDLTGRCNSIWIAGGAVVDLDRASDIDVWFGKSQEDKAQECVEKFQYSDPFSRSQDYGNGFMLREGWVPEVNKMVQILVTKDELP